MWNPWRNGPSGWIYVAMLAPNFIVSPGLLQKVYGARDDRAVRVGVGVNAVCLLLYALVPVLLGMSARVLHPGLTNADRDMALPLLFMNDLPFWVGALGLAAVFSAEVSAADAVLFMLATSLSQDLVQALRQSRRVRPAGREGRAGRVGRAAPSPPSWSRCRRRAWSTRSGSSTPWSASACSSRSSPACICAVRRRSTRWPPLPAASLMVGRRCKVRNERHAAGSHFAVRPGRRAGVAFGTGRQSLDTETRVKREAGLFDLTGKTAVVIGAGIGHRRGGRARLRGAGGAGRLPRRQRGRGAAGGGEGDGRRLRMRGGRLDICDGPRVERVFTDLDARYGVDIAICTPAINVRKPILKYTDEELSRVLDVNIKGNFHVLRAAGRVMTARKKGSIILFSSIRSR